jgi:DNA repair exonuclease SbcCD nuclease subunit
MESPQGNDSTAHHPLANGVESIEKQTTGHTTMSNEPTQRLRIAHISDTHLGYRAIYRADPETGRNQRALDVERAYEDAITDILKRDVDLVIHAGDVFHHTRPSWAALRCFVRQTRRLSDAGLPVVVIGGNHDTPRLRTSGSVFSVLELALPGIDFVAGYADQTFDFERFNLKLFAVPHGKLTDIEPPILLPEPGKRNVLMTHGLVPGMAIKGHHEPGEEEISDTLLDTDFDYIALGHYHVSGKQRHNAWYSGSTERFGWGDEDVDPGYLLVELGEPGEPPEVVHIPLVTRPMKTLHFLDGEGREARDLADLVLDKLSTLAIPDAMTRIELRNTPRPIRREAERFLRRESSDYVWSLQVYSPADVLSGFTARQEAAELDVRALFREFVAERRKNGDIDPAFATAFEERGSRALDDALRAADAATSVEDAAA